MTESTTPGHEGLATTSTPANADSGIIPDPLEFAGHRRGLLQAGERVSVQDGKGHRHTILLEPGKTWHTTKGGLEHDQIIGQPEGIVVATVGGLQYMVFRPLLNQYVVSMPREAAIIYPKDSAQILSLTDIFPGARVLEAGVGSGSLSLSLLRAIGPTGRLYSYERRQAFATVAKRNVEEFLGCEHPGWSITIGDLAEVVADEPVDRVILDMLAPWDCLDAVAKVLEPGGVLCVYVATTTQMGRIMDTLRAHGGFTEPSATETTVREWHAEGLAIRPGHGTSAHTGFLVISRRLAPGVTAPFRKRRPAPGAYGPDYVGPIPQNVTQEHLKANQEKVLEQDEFDGPMSQTLLKETLKQRAAARRAKAAGERATEAEADGGTLDGRDEL